MKVCESSLVQQLGQLVAAMGKKLVVLVERGKLRLEEDGVLLGQAQAATVGGGVVARHSGQCPPLQSEILSPLVL